MNPSPECTETAAPALPSAEAPTTPPKHKSHKGLLIGVGSLLCAGGIAAGILFGGSLAGGSKNENVYYIKNGAMIAANVGETPAYLTLTDNISRDELSSYEMTLLSSFMLLSENGSTLFYPDVYDTHNGSFTLYCRDTEDAAAEPVLIDTGVVFYRIDRKAKQIYYVRREGETASLHRRTLEDGEMTQLASDINPWFYADADCLRVLYTVSEDVSYTDAAGALHSETLQKLYLIKNGSQPECIEEGVSEIVQCSNEVDDLYYCKQGSLYRKQGDAAAMLWVADCGEIVRIYDSGEVYFQRENTTTVTLLDYVEDDLQESDAALTEPVYPEPPTYPQAPEYVFMFDYATDAEYQAAYAKYLLDFEAYEAECERLYETYEADCTQYYLDYEQYNEKLVRDSLRETLRELTIGSGSDTLYYSDGTEPIAVHDCVADRLLINDVVSGETARIVFEIYEPQEFAKIQLSAIDDDYTVYDLRGAVREALYGTKKQFYADGSKALPLPITVDADTIITFVPGESSDEIYYLRNLSADETTADLYRIIVADGKAGNEKLYDTAIFAPHYVSAEGHMYYFKNVPVEDGAFLSVAQSGDLYIDRQLADHAVKRSDILYSAFSAEEFNWYYIADYNEAEGTGTLKYYNGSESVNIAAGVTDYFRDDHGRLLYISEYNAAMNSGTLYCYEDGKSITIDEGVTKILSVMRGTARISEHFVN